MRAGSFWSTEVTPTNVAWSEEVWLAEDKAERVGFNPAVFDDSQ